MTDSMKFGPEWLRNLSSEGTTSGTVRSSTHYTLADHRYGREEMLALFEQSLKLKPPVSMLNFKSLFVDQPLTPLALSPMTEDENRLWSTRSIPPGAPRGRGGSMDRGRTRGRGNTFHPSFNRSNSAYDDPIRPFDRNQSERGWPERNGDMNDWGSGSSPRKDFSSNRSMSSLQDNWRRHRTEDSENDGWRLSNHRAGSLQETNKWNSGGGAPTRNISGNWRDGESRNDDHLSDRQANNRVSWHSQSDSNRNNSQRRVFDIDDHLPEWATENPSETGGSFDATGAFHGSDDDQTPEKGPHKSTNTVNNSLQKSVSQQNITTTTTLTKKSTPLSTSQSATNLINKNKSDEIQQNKTKNEKEKKDTSNELSKHTEETTKTKAENTNKSNTEIKNNQNEKKEVQDTESRENKNDKQNQNNLNNDNKTSQIEIDMDFYKKIVKKIDDEFDHMKEVTDDIVAKLILDDEIPKNSPIQQQQQQQQQTDQSQRGGVSSSAQAPNVGPIPFPTNLTNVLVPQAAPNLPPPPPGTSQDKWFYRDPQGEVQGPFTSQEMADWFRAGYFTVSLLVRRQCDERYFTLGDLVKQCGGIPFLNCRLSPLKHEAVASIGLNKDITDPLQIQQLNMQRILQRHADAVRILSQSEPWSSLNHMQQKDLVTQHIMSHPQVLSEMPFIHQMSNNQLNNPLMHMINQMQQTNKLPMQQPVVEKPPNSLNNTQNLDPLQTLIQQIGGLQPNISANVPPQIVPQTQAADTTKQPQQKEDPIRSLLRQLANQPPQQREFWDIRPQPPYSAPPAQQPTQWMGGAPQIPTHTMWDMHTPPPQQIIQNSVGINQNHQQIPMPPSATNKMGQNITEQQVNAMKEMDKEEHKKKEEFDKEQKQKERKEAMEREKKKKELEQLEKARLQKEAEEKRKEEQRKLEVEKKMQAERLKKEEERVKKELEKAKREAEEKRLRELEEKRRLKEQRKVEEETRKKAEEDRKKEEEERQRKEQEKQREEQSRKQAEALKKMQESQQKTTKVAPWCQGPNSTPAAATNNLTLAEIQRIEREKKLTEAALFLQQQKAASQAKEVQDQQAVEKTNFHLNWASKKPILPKKVKSLAEIQQEEQERVAKQIAEARLAQKEKEKEQNVSLPVHASIWSGASQSLIWSNNQQNSSGFWDDNPLPQQPTRGKSATQLTTVQKLTPQKSQIVVNSVAQGQKILQQKQTVLTNEKTVPITEKKANKSRAKKEEENLKKIFDKNAATSDEFVQWCMKTLSALNSDVDVPTFANFLRDIESPYDVKDYVRQYLGDSSQAMQFANQFLEKRSKMKEQQRIALQHKDDLCQPAPAINPSSEFQEVKGKNKKQKKAKMTKIDARNLGFSVTAAENRINIGDRDYVES